MRAVCLLAVSVVSSCLQVGTGTETGAGNGTGSTMGMAGSNAPVASRSAKGDGGPTGTNCLEDHATQTLLCEQVDVCPGVDVDPGAFPDCGFRTGGGLLDLECLCGTALCPIGVPATCQQAKALLNAQNVLDVCAQQSEGRCVQLAAPVAPDAGTGNTCDPSCRDECAGAPSCVQLCGC